MDETGNFKDGFQSAIKNHQSTIFNKNPSNSNKTHTAGTSTCSGSRVISSNSWDNTGPDRERFARRFQGKERCVVGPAQHLEHRRSCHSPFVEIYGRWLMRRDRQLPLASDSSNRRSPATHPAFARLAHTCRVQESSFHPNFWRRRRIVRSPSPFRPNDPLG